MKAEIRYSLVLGIILFVSCSSSSDSEADNPSTDTSDLPTDVAARFAHLQNEIESSKDMTSESFFEKYQVRFGDSIGHLPLEAENLELIQSSDLALGLSFS